MAERLMILAAPSAADDVRARLDAAGGRRLATYGATAWVVELPFEAEAAFAGDPALVGVFAGAVPDTVMSTDEAERLGIAAWNLRQSAAFRASRHSRRGEGRAWDDEGFEPEG